MERVVVDANVFVSFLTRRHEEQYGAAVDPLAGLADASIVAVAGTNRYETVATFDRKLANRLASFGLAAYW